MQPLKHIQLFAIWLLIVLSSACSPSDPPKEKRNFYMGVTPWPANFTSQDLDNAYLFINTNCDIVSHHFDDGIPYEEAYNNLSMPMQLQNDITTRLQKTNSSKKVLLSVAALNLTRKEKADYYRNSTISSTIQNNWAALSFTDTEVVTAYLNYLEYLITNFEPDYLNFGVESNNPEFTIADFNNYKDFLGQVYGALKVNHPNLPCFISFIVSESPQGFNYANALLPYTDIIGISSYPYTHISSSGTGNTNPDLFPDNFFENYIFMANKPFCFAETAYIAEDLVVSSFNLNKQGNEDWQNKYLNKILSLSQEHNAEFIIWFCSKDYDEGNLYLQQQGLYMDLFALWQDTGFLDENGNQRLAYTTWNNWMNKDKK